jgi:hypothetical protein
MYSFLPDTNIILIDGIFKQDYELLLALPAEDLA